MRVFQHSWDLCHLPFITNSVTCRFSPCLPILLKTRYLCILCRNINICFSITYGTRKHIYMERLLIDSSIIFLYKCTFSYPLDLFFFPLISEEAVPILVHVSDKLGLIWSLVHDGRFIYVPKSTRTVLSTHFSTKCMKKNKTRVLQQWKTTFLQLKYFSMQQEKHSKDEYTDNFSDLSTDFVNNMCLHW
jgi:hypothetical protein